MMRQRLGRIITWAFIIVDSVMVTLGVLYAAGLLAQSTALLSLVEPWALFLSSWLLTPHPRSTVPYDSDGACRGKESAENARFGRVT